MSTSAVRQQHATWLSLIDTQGPFLTLPVLTRTLHDGLEPVAKRDWNALRPAYQSWAADRDSTTKGAPAHDEWVQHVVGTLLDWDADADWAGPFEQWSHTEVEHDVTVTPTFTLNDTTGTPVALGFVHPYDTPLTGRVKDDGWAANRLDRAAATLRATGVEFGVVTDGRWWTLVWAPLAGATAHAVWDAVLWLEDRTTLDAFTTLLSRRRFLAVADDATLKAMLDASLDSQEEVTDQLGKQVREAAEFLVEAFGRADHHEGGHRLVAVDNDEIYNGAVTVLMRLVFMFCAEERRLLPADSDFYLRAYSVSALADRLAQEAADQGESTLEHSTAAWHQLLATFRIVYAGSSHQSFSLPGYGGSIFDPTKYPWLEGDRQRGPIPVDDRTVYHILRGLTRLTFREKGVTESRKISYRALDVEQIGYVYEGLLDHTATRATDTTLGFTGKHEPEITLAELAAQAGQGPNVLTTWLTKQTGLTASAVKKGLAEPADPSTRDALRRQVYAACDNDNDLTEQVLVYASLLRRDPRGLPTVYLRNRLFVTSSSTRGNTGTHYTPRDLAERVVATTLEALVYKPGPLDTEDRNQWKTVSAAEILDLRIADIAMGSGAFLVAACRYLADRLLEAILKEDPDALDGELVDVWVLATDRVATIATADAEVDEAVLYARRLITERCLYGTDLNPMAVEMAKLSLWLITAARDKPFGFLDHRLVAGDSLLGLTSVEQVEYLHLDPRRGRTLHAEALTDHTAHVRRALRDAADLRTRLAATPALDLRAVETKRELLEQAEARLADLALLADAVVGAGIDAATSLPGLLDTHLIDVAERVPALLDRDVSEEEQSSARKTLRAFANEWLNKDRPTDAFARQPLQWVTRFPEVFMEGETGFDAIIGNPPFLGGKKISRASGDSYREYLVLWKGAGIRGSADLVAYFFTTAFNLLSAAGELGLIATNTVWQGDTREVALDQIVQRGTIRAAVKSEKWPSSSANLEYALVWLTRSRLATQPVLDGLPVSGITSGLDPRSRVVGLPHRLAQNAKQCFQGVIPLGSGFVMPADQATAMIGRNPQNSAVLHPFVSGDDLTSTTDVTTGRWIVDFGERSAAEASRFQEPWAWIEQRVKPERLTKDAVKYPKMVNEWWKFWNSRPALRSAIEPLEQVIVVPRVSKYFVPTFASPDCVFNDLVCVCAYDDFGHLGLLSSSFHYWWVVKNTSTLETRIRYTPTDAFETFPHCAISPEVEDVARRLHDHRNWLMQDRGWGITETYNAMHEPATQDDDVASLRDYHVRLDAAVGSAYGWSDLSLDHGFFETRQGMRFTVAPAPRIELLDRLLETNHSRHADEMKRSAPRGAKKRASTGASDSETGQDGLFAILESGE